MICHFHARPQRVRYCDYQAGEGRSLLPPSQSECLLVQPAAIWFAVTGIYHCAAINMRARILPLFNRAIMLSGPRSKALHRLATNSIWHGCRITTFIPISGSQLRLVVGLRPRSV